MKFSDKDFAVTNFARLGTFNYGLYAAVDHFV